MPHATSTEVSGLPIILCLHGMGTSAAIFSAQTRNLRLALKQHFRFIFIDAPHESLPGPGVEPTYVDSGPFYSWFSDSMGTTAVATAHEFCTLSAYINASIEKQGYQTSDIVSVMGFSQGTIVASMLLYQAETPLQNLSLNLSAFQNSTAENSWPSLRFGILLSGSCNDHIVTAFMGRKLQLPSVHLYGLQDPYLKNARMLYEQIYHEKMADLVEFDGGHNIPGNKADLDKLTARILRLNRRTKGKLPMRAR
ncbi:serine hydrolase FSH [Halenospora varia]|nr:serine hydrolase FSH [Halenospora varia]